DAIVDLRRWTDVLLFDEPVRAVQYLCDEGGADGAEVAGRQAPLPQFETFPPWGESRHTTSRPLSGAGRPCRALLVHPEVLELPGIVAVEVLVEQGFPALQGCPVAIFADDVAEVGGGYLEDVVGGDVVGLDD